MEEPFVIVYNTLIDERTGRVVTRIGLGEVTYAETPVSAQFIRVRVRNNGKRTAEETNGRVELINDTGNTRNSIDTLKWAPNRYEYAERPLNIRKKEYEMLDVVVTKDSDDAIFHLNTVRQIWGYGRQFGLGNYYLKIAIYSKNAESKGYYELVKGQGWQNTTMRRINLEEIPEELRNTMQWDC